MSDIDESIKERFKEFLAFEKKILSLGGSSSFVLVQLQREEEEPEEDELPDENPELNSYLRSLVRRIHILEKHGNGYRKSFLELSDVHRALAEYVGANQEALRGLRSDFAVALHDIELLKAKDTSIREAARMGKERAAAIEGRLQILEDTCITERDDISVLAHPVFGKVKP